MDKIDNKVQSIMDYISQQADELDQEQQWELYSMLSYRCRSQVDDLEDAQQDKEDDLN